MGSRAWRAVERWGWLPLVLIAAVFCAEPVVEVDDFVEATRGCFAAVRQPRGPELPDCRASASLPERAGALPWMRRQRELYAEELEARWAHVRYLDAGVGVPDRGAAFERARELQAAAQLVLDGSGRQSLDLLGPRIGVPEPGRLAMSLGDRRTLLDAARRWTTHDVQLATLRAALLEGDVAAAHRIGKAYAGSPSEDLRMQVAALACLQGDAGGGTRLASEIETRRATKRTANFRENFGAARVLLETCSALAGALEPDVPAYGYAGDWDHRERLVLLRVRLLMAGCARHPDAAPCLEQDELAATIEHAVEMLGSGWPRAYRLELMAVVASSLDSLEQASKLARPSQDESSVAARAPLWPGSWLELVADAPVLTPGLALEGAAALEALSAAVGDVPREPLRQTAAALRMKAGIELALRGDGDEGARWAGPAARLLHGDDVGELGAAIARLLAGDVAGARVAAERGSSPHAALLRAELALPDRAAAARHARDALAAAERAHDALAGERARWLLVALGDDAATVASGAERPRVPDLGPLDLPISAAARAADVADSIATWAVWRAGSSEERRAARYALLEHRDVYPASLAAYVFAAGQLVDEPAEVEPWLDVVMARFEPRIGLRRYAFVRWRVARWRGDVASSRWWRRRFDELAARLADGGEAELWQALGL